MLICQISVLYSLIGNYFLFKSQFASASRRQHTRKYREYARVSHSRARSHACTRRRTRRKRRKRKVPITERKIPASERTSPYVGNRESAREKPQTLARFRGVIRARKSSRSSGAQRHLTGRERTSIPAGKSEREFLLVFPLRRRRLASALSRSFRTPIASLPLNPRESTCLYGRRRAVSRTACKSEARSMPVL